MEINQHPMNNQWVMEEIKREMKNISKQMKMENTKYQNLQDVAKEVLRAKFSVMNACNGEEEKSHIKKLNFKNQHTEIPCIPIH